MSETATPDLDLRAELARINRDRAETAKFAAEQRKLISKSRKLDRDRLLAPWLAILGVIGGLITIAGALWRVLHG